MKYLIEWCLRYRYGVLLFYLGLFAYGLWVMPFEAPWLPSERDRIPIDAIPDLGENQQIVFTHWPGRSPQDIEDQITYPLTTLLQGLPGVKNYSLLFLFRFLFYLCGV